MLGDSHSTDTHTPDVIHQNEKQHLNPHDTQNEEQELAKDTPKTLWIIIGVVLAVFIVLIICYSSFRNGDDNAKAEYLLLDTQATKDAQWTTDSIKMVERVTPDLAFFELHGPVKTLKCGTYETHTYKFDEEGNLEKIDGYNPFTVDIYSSGYENPIRYSRNSRGQITEEQGWESQRIYTWNGEHLSRSEGGAEGYSSTISYHYDGRGFMTYEDCNSEWYGGEECETYHISYTYIEIDHYGNWVERTAVYSNGRRETERRKIEYFPITRY